MKKFILILIISIGINFYLSAQPVGTYRSVANGNWNDPAKWQVFNGSTWVSATTYPGQNAENAGAGISPSTIIILTATVPYPIVGLYIDDGGELIFSAQNSISLTVSADVFLYGKISVENQSSAKTHTLFAGGGFFVGQDDFSGNPYYTGSIQGINGDDKINVTLNGTNSINDIEGSSNGFSFQDVTFNGAGFTVFTGVTINGKATFINGIVNVDTSFVTSDGTVISSRVGSITFARGATCSGASHSSFIDAVVYKTGDDPFTFPIGDEGIFSPISISAPVGQTASFSAQYIRASATALGTITDPGLSGVSNCEYWNLLGAGNSIDLTVGWTGVSSCDMNNVADLTLAHFNGASWDDHGGTATGTTTNGSVTWAGAYSYGQFTIGKRNGAPVCNIPSGLNATNITISSATLTWLPVPGAVSYDADYGGSSWINLGTATTSTSINLLGLSHSTSYTWRVRANCSSGSSGYRQGWFSTLEGCGTPERLTVYSITSNSARIEWPAVSNALSYTVEFKTSTSGTWIPATTDTPSLFNSSNGPYVVYNLTGLTPLTEYDVKVQATCINIPGDFVQTSFTTAPPPVCNDVYEPNNSPGTARTINLGTIISAGISSATDIDWFRITSPNTTNTTLQVILNNLAADYDLYVYNKGLTLVGSSITAGNEDVTFNVRGKNSIYYINIVGKNGAYNTSQCYNLLAQVSGTARPVTNSSTPLNEINEGLSKQPLYPNPASEFVYLNFNSATEGLVNIQIVNSIGELVKQHPVNTIKGYNLIKIQVADIRPGMYILRINKSDLNLSRKFVIAR